MSASVSAASFSEAQETATTGRGRSSGVFQPEDLPILESASTETTQNVKRLQHDLSFKSKFSSSSGDSDETPKSRRARLRKKFKMIPKFRTLEKGRFVGRQSYLQKLKDMFQEDDAQNGRYTTKTTSARSLVSFNNKVNSNSSVLLTNSLSIATVRGRHGIGKTALAYVYARAFEMDYDRLLWLNAKCIAWDAREILATHLDELGIEAEAAAMKEETDVDVIRIRFIHFLITLPGRWLLILDGADNPSLTVRTWLPNSQTAYETSSFVTARSSEASSVYSGPSASSAGGYASTFNGESLHSVNSPLTARMTVATGNISWRQGAKERLDGLVHGRGHVLVTAAATKSIIENSFATFSVIPKQLELGPLGFVESSEILRQKVPHIPLGNKPPPELSDQELEEWKLEEKALSVLIDKAHLGGEPLQLALLGNLVGKFRLSFQKVLHKYNFEKKLHEVEKYRKAKAQVRREKKYENATPKKKKKQPVVIQMTSKLYDVDSGLKRFGLEKYLSRVVELGIITMDDMSRGRWWQGLGGLDCSQDVERFEELRLWVRTRISLVSLQVVWVLWKKVLHTFSPLSLSVLRKSAYLCEDRIPYEFLPPLLNKAKSDLGTHNSEDMNRPRLVTDLCNSSLLRREKSMTVSMSPLLQSAIRKADAGGLHAYEAAVATLQTVYEFCHRRWADASSGRHVSWTSQQAMFAVLPQVIKVRQRCVDELSRNKKHRRLKILEYMERQSEKETTDPFGIKRTTDMLFSRLQARKRFPRTRGESEVTEDSSFSGNTNRSGSTVTSTSPLTPDFKGRDLALIEADLALVQGILVLQMPFRNSTRYEDAEKCFRAAHSRYKDYPKELEHPKSIWLIANCLFHRSNLEGSLKMFELALHQYHEVHGKYTNHLDVARCIGSIACTYHQMGKIPDAMKYHELAVQMVYDVCGADAQNVHVARALMNKGRTHVKAGEYEQALSLFDNVFEIYKNIAERRKGYNRQVGRVMIECSKVNIMIGNDSSEFDALDCFNCAMRVFQRVVYLERIEMEPKTGSTVKNEDEEEQCIVRLESLSAENLQKLPNHELIADAMTDVGELLVDVGKVNEGRLLFEEGLHQYEAVYSDFPHPKYIAKVKSYFNLLCNLGEEETARAMEERLQRFQAL